MTASKWENFTEEELTCPCGCGRQEMDDIFMQEMVERRKECGFAWPVTSGFRCPEYNDEIYVRRGFEKGAHLSGPHTTGRAMDILLSRKKADIADRSVVISGIVTGRGWKQHGKNRFLHFDNLPNADGQPRPTIFSYPS